MSDMPDYSQSFEEMFDEEPNFEAMVNLKQNLEQENKNLKQEIEQLKQELLEMYKRRINNSKM